MKMSRVWAMPSGDTLSIPPIAGFVASHLVNHAVTVDPFARNSRVATFRNDLNPETAAEYHMDARAFLQMLIDKGVVADAVIMDPPYSARQTAELYSSIGLKTSMQDTQLGATNKQCRDLFRKLLRPNGKVLSFGWNSCSMGPTWETLEIMLVSHGGNHNDTICMAERENAAQSEMDL